MIALIEDEEQIVVGGKCGIDCGKGAFFKALNGFVIAFAEIVAKENIVLDL